MKKLPIHPLADLLPRMTPAEYDGLKASIADGGQTDPVVTLDGKVLDGRHRQDACHELKAECKYVEFKKAWGDPVKWVMAKAVHRNLTDSQKACAAANFADNLTPDAEARKAANLRGRTGATSVKVGDAEFVDAEALKAEQAAALGRSVDRAAAVFGVSPRYVSDARWLRSQDVHAFGRVFAGNVKLSVAKAEVRRNDKRKQLRKAPADVPAGRGSWTVAEVDCLAGLPTLPRQSARLVVADPQYNIGYDYGDGPRGDKRTPEQYLQFTAAWLAEARDVLAPDGSLWVVISDEYAAELVVAAKAAGFHLRSWVCWYETFGVNCADNFNRTKRHVLYLVKDRQRFVFDRAVFNRPSDRQTKYADKRAAAGGKVWDDVWGINPPIPRLVDNAAERLPDFPTQLPLALVEPIVRGCSEPGDLVVDPFNGSGTTGDAAVTWGRHYYGTDTSRKFAAASRLRLRRVGTEVGFDHLLTLIRRPT